MPGHLVPGSRVADRYVLEAELGRGSACTVWRALDERLERRVAVRLYHPEIDRGLLEERTGMSASLTHPRAVRIFDTGHDSGHFFTVSELLPGALAWTQGPLPASDVIELGSQVAEALAYAHERGVAHGGLHAGNVLLSEQGARVADFSLSGQALDGSPEPHTDLVDLGRLLYRALTGRTPGDRDVHGRPLPDEPQGLAAIVLGLADGTYTDASRVAEDLRRLRPTPDAATKPRPKLWLAAAVATILAVLGLGLVFLGDQPPPGPGPTPGERVTGVAVPIATVADYDPLGDERENRHIVENIYDGDPQTFWSTERYRGGPDFSGLKSGVGVIFDLGSAEVVGKAQVLFASPGCSFEIRYSTTRSHTIDGWEVVASVEGAGIAAGVEFPAQESRWWLLWITRLTEGVPDARGGWACAVAEVEFFR